jgi:Zn-dependent protease
MNERLNWMLPSVYVGRMYSTDVRVSLWFALVLLVICPRHGFELGFTYAALLYASVFLHEFAHVFVARRTGGFADEIHLTPLGGLALAKPGPGAFNTGITAMAGPSVNLFICALVCPAWYAPDLFWKSLNPLVLPITQIRMTELWTDLGLILFYVNWMAFLVNLLPVMPLDGGQVLRAVFTANNQIHPELVHRTASQVGMVVAVLLLLVGVSFDLSQVVLIGTFVLLTNVVQLFQEEIGEGMDDSTFGYDFSAGYESLERSNPTTTREVKPGMLQRWRDRRRLRREQQERIRIMEAEQKLDLLLAKVHESGLDSLTDQEKNLLRNCSELLRDKNKSSN